MVKKDLIAISTVNMSREEWLEHRRNTIGGSDAAAIVGLSKWATPLTVYMDKMGLAPDKPDSIPMRIGRELEETVAATVAEAAADRMPAAMGADAARMQGATAWGGIRPVVTAAPTA